MGYQGHQAAHLRKSGIRVNGSALTNKNPTANVVRSYSGKPPNPQPVPNATSKNHLKTPSPTLSQTPHKTHLKPPNLHPIVNAPRSAFENPIAHSPHNPLQTLASTALLPTHTNPLQKNPLAFHLHKPHFRNTLESPISRRIPNPAKKPI